MRRRKGSRATGRSIAKGAGLPLLVAALAAALLAFAAIPPALAAEGWSGPALVSTKSEHNENACIAVDSRGVVHVVWNEWKEFEIWYNCGTPGSWSEPVLLSTHASVHCEPQMALTPDGKAHVVWDDSKYGVDGRVWYCTGAGSAWSAPAPIYDKPGYDQENPSIAVGPDGSVHVAWEDCGDHLKYGIWYSTNAGGSWLDKPERLSTHSEELQTEPRIAMGPDGSAHVVWYGKGDSAKYGIWYSTNAGGSWLDKPERLSTHSEELQTEPRIAVGPDGRAHVVWHGPDASGGDDRIWYSSDAGKSWLDEPVLLSEKLDYWQGDPQIAVGLDGRAHVVWAGRANHAGDSLVWYSTNAGGSWLDKPKRLSTHSEELQTEPRIAMGPDGRAHVVWRGYGEDEDYLRVWYSACEGGACTDPLQLSEQPDMDSYSPHIALDISGNPHVAWGDADKNIEAGDIYCSASITSYTHFLAEGSTAGGMETWVLVQNPNANPVTVNLTLMTDTGEEKPSALRNQPIDPYSRRSFPLHNHVSTYDVSTLVTSVGGDVICERAMYGPGRLWAHDSVGVTAPAGTWYLAEGSTAGDMETWVLVQNPNPKAVTVSLTLMTDAGEQKPAGLQNQQIPVGSRRSFPLHEYLTTYDVSTKVTSVGGDVICERAMYGPGRAWAHDSIGLRDILP